MLSAAPAAAQTTNGLIIDGTRVELEQGEEYERPNNERPYWISYEDCLRDDAYILPIDANSSNGNVEVWAGNDDCAANRSQQDKGQCWLVASVEATTTPVNLRIPMRTVVNRDLNATRPPENLSAQVCDQGDSRTGEAVTYFVLRVRGGQVEDRGTWGGGGLGAADTGIDVLGPSAPSGGIELSIGEGELIIDVDERDDDNDIARFQAYCVPLDVQADTTTLPGPDAGSPTISPTDTGAGAGPDAGTGPDAGLLEPDPDSAAPTTTMGTSGTAGSSSGQAGASFDAGLGSCNSQVLAQGERPSLQASTFKCGELGRNTRRGGTNRLVNGVTYAVALAAEDDIGNAGVLSNVACATPIELVDFFELYSRQGGPGGGGFCSLQPGQPTGSRTGGGLLLAALLLGLVRRRKEEPSLKHPAARTRHHQSVTSHVRGGLS